MNNTKTKPKKHNNGITIKIVVVCMRCTLCTRNHHFNQCSAFLVGFSVDGCDGGCIFLSLTLRSFYLCALHSTHSSAFRAAKSICNVFFLSSLLRYLNSEKESFLHQLVCHFSFAFSFLGNGSLILYVYRATCNCNW